MIVSESSSTSKSVTLDRVVAKLKLSFSDKIPSGLSTISVTPGTWYYGLDYITGEPVSEVNSLEKVFDIPSSYIGTTGNLSVSIFGFSSDGEWSTDIYISAKDSNGNTIGYVTIPDAPFSRNVSTEYSGKLFHGNSGFSLMVDDNWNDTYEGEW